MTPKTHVLMIVDSSGSMSHLRDSVISQMNEFLQDRKNDPCETLVTMVTFDAEYNVVFHEVPAADVPTLTLKDYVPSGATALFDAIARACTSLEGKVKLGERALVNIITDGEENASVEYALHIGGKAKIKALIERLMGTGNWTFTYASADVNAFADAGQMGIPVGNIRQFVPTQLGYVQSATITNQSTTKYVTSANLSSADFYAPQEEESTP